METEFTEPELEVYTLLNPDFGWPVDDCWNDDHRKEIESRKDPLS
ncbi:hypothetical protein [Thalassobacillus pellis]|nr:hypothetical protein [Thalassobacillus pellis]MBM7554104.1 hypothetical protein [Thalassobacillus pellis]